MSGSPETSAIHLNRKAETLKGPHKVLQSILESPMRPYHRPIGPVRPRRALRPVATKVRLSACCMVSRPSTPKPQTLPSRASQAPPTETTAMGTGPWPLAQLKRYRNSSLPIAYTHCCGVERGPTASSPSDQRALHSILHLTNMSRVVPTAKVPSSITQGTPSRFFKIDAEETIG